MVFNYTTLFHQSVKLTKLTSKEKTHIELVEFEIRTTPKSILQIMEGIMSLKYTSVRINHHHRIRVALTSNNNQMNTTTKPTHCTLQAAFPF